MKRQWIFVFPEIQKQLDTWNIEGKPDSITDERAQSFSDLADWIVEQRDVGKSIQLMFVCTHNPVVVTLVSCGLKHQRHI